MVTREIEAQGKGTMSAPTRGWNVAVEYGNRIVRSDPNPLSVLEQHGFWVNVALPNNAMR